jgi:hypothetical protein
MKWLLFSSFLWPHLIKGAWALQFGKFLCERCALYGIIVAVCPHLPFISKELLTSFQGVLSV